MEALTTNLDFCLKSFIRRAKIENYKLLRSVEILEETVDSLSKQVHNLRQQQDNMLEQIRRLKELNNDGSGK